MVVMFLPTFSGAGCPRLDPRSLSSFVGLSQSCHKDDMLRADHEKMDLQFLNIVKTMHHDLGVPFDQLVFISSATEDEILDATRRTSSAASACPLRRPTSKRPHPLVQPC